MIWLQMLLFASTSVVLPTPQNPSADEIVVIGRKLQLTQGVIKTNKLSGKSVCTVEKTSGNARVDKAVCEIAVACLRTGQDGPAFRPCVLDGRRRFLARLASADEGNVE